jgi:hypothetical protein
VPKGENNEQTSNRIAIVITNSKMEVGSGYNIFYYKISKNSEET